MVAEITSGKYHEFSLVAIQNSEKKFLQLYDERWNCWLFPYVRSTDDNKAMVDCYVSDLLEQEIETEYVTHANHCKYSVSDEVYKIYNHKLYKLFIETVPESMSGDTFSIDGKKYCWMSIDEMEHNDEIMEKNDEVVAFVKVMCS